MIPRIISIFISSPNDVKDERNITKKIIEELSQRLRTIYGVVLTYVSWEELGSFAAEKRIQETITQNLEKCLIFIGILGERFGTIDLKGSSPTKEEFDFAIRHKNKMEVLTYCLDDSMRKIKNDEESINQAYHLNELKSVLKKEEILFKQYKDLNDFHNIVLLDLLKTILGMLTEIKRRNFLEKFFLFGLHRKQREVSVLIGYPPIHKHFGPTQRKTYNWRERLLPNIVYEDFRTIRKVESALDCLGINYKTVTTYYKDLQEPGNRIWLCIPRNNLAKEKLRTFGNRVNFTFRGDNPENRFIEWSLINSNLNKPIIIKSPLSNYLLLQRPEVKSPWKPKYGDIVSRDFAVLSRFENDIESKGHSEHKFYHYFMAGIRGLGTWGVGWYIDNCFDELASTVETINNRDIQIILEVEFCNYRIKNVKDVSNNDQEYFDQINSIDFIKQHIKKERSKNA